MMTPFQASVTRLLASTILVSDILIVLVAVCLILYAFKKAPAFFDEVIDFFGSYGMVIAFLAAFGSLFGSLYYSRVVGFPPCELCILQRIFMYPQVLLFGVWLWKRHFAPTIALSSAMLSVVGGAIGVFQYYGQMFNPNALPCSAAAVSCAVREFVEYGYVTIPMMSVTSFAIILVSLLLWYLSRRRAQRMPVVEPYGASH